MRAFSSRCHPKDAIELNGNKNQDDDNDDDDGGGGSS